ncbi:MAG: DUF302 domain-containing protein [bacterium]
MIGYGFTKELDISFDEAIEVVTEALKKEKFGVLTRINAHEKFKEKLGIDFKKYVILGTCNPKHAHEAILAEENIGLMLPCNVLVYEKDEKTTVSIIKPTSAMGMIDNSKLSDIAIEVEKKLKRVFDSI